MILILVLLHHSLLTYFSPFSRFPLYHFLVYMSFLLSFCHSCYLFAFRHSHSSYFSSFSFLLLFVIHTPPTSRYFLFSYFSSFTLLLLLTIFFSLTFRHSHSSYFSPFSFLLLFVIHTPLTSRYFLFSYFSSFTLLLLLSIFFSLTSHHFLFSYFSSFPHLLRHSREGGNPANNKFPLTHYSTDLNQLKKWT